MEEEIQFVFEGRKDADVVEEQENVPKSEVTVTPDAVEAFKKQVLWDYLLFILKQKVHGEWVKTFTWLGGEIDLLTYLDLGGEDWREDIDVWRKLSGEWIYWLAMQNGYVDSPEDNPTHFVRVKFSECYKETEVGEILIESYCKGKGLTPEKKLEFILSSFFEEHGNDAFRNLIKNIDRNRQTKKLNANAYVQIKEMVNSEGFLSDDSVRNLLDRQKKPYLYALAFDVLKRDFQLGIDEEPFFKALGCRRPSENIKRLVDDSMDCNLRRVMSKKLRELLPEYSLFR